MAVRSAIRFLARVAVVVLVVVPLLAVWLSGRLGRSSERPYEPPGTEPLATLPRSETSATPAPRPPRLPDPVPTPAPPVTVGAGAVTVPPPVPGARPAPTPREGRVIDPGPGGP